MNAGAEGDVRHGLHVRPGKRVVVAISGGGRSLANLLARQSDLAYEICGVISSRPDARGCEIAIRNGLPLVVLDFHPDNGNSGESARLQVEEFVTNLRASWIVLAGFLRMFPVMRGWEQRTINIHPALLPKFGGKGMYGDRVHAAVLRSGDRETGATIHYVSGAYDEGAVIAQTRVPVHAGDSTAMLAARVFAAECELLPRTLDELVSGRRPGQRGGHPK